MAIENGILKPNGTIQLRGGTAAALTIENPLPARREIMLEVDTGKHKVGNGIDRWNMLPYSGGSSGSSGETGMELTETQLRRLNILYAAFFPNDDDNIILPYTPFENLPTGTPPDWVSIDMPSGFKAYSGVHKMFYGCYNYKISSSGNFSHIDSGLHVLLLNSSSKTSVVSMTSLTSVSETNYIYEPTAADGRYLDYAMDKNMTLYYTAGEGVICTVSGSNSSSLSNNTVLASSILSDCNSLCYSDDLDLMIAVGATGSVVLMAYNSTTKRHEGTAATKYMIGIAVNPACAVWSSSQLVFCVTGSQGTAVSANGITWDTNTGTNVPKNLTDLIYREDLGCFMAWSKDTKLFYASGDGIEWEKVSNTPIPLETVSQVEYTPSTGIYCAVGGTGNKAYFSKDLTDWVSTNVTNASINVGSVIYVPRTKKYVLVPTEGDKFYTFDTSDWITDNAATHNEVLVDESLGVFSSSISSVIRDGTFTGIYPGRYIDFKNVAYEYPDENDEIQKDTYSGRMRALHLDYPQYCGEKTFPYHSVLFAPDTAMFNAPMNDTNTTEGGYVNTKMRKVYLRRAEAIFKACFGADHVLTHQEYLVNEVTNGVPTGTVLCDTTVELMDERMVFGVYQKDSGTHNRKAEPEVSIFPHRQLALFRLNYNLATDTQTTTGANWLRNVNSAAYFAYVSDGGYVYCDIASLVGGVRPAALIH